MSEGPSERGEGSSIEQGGRGEHMWGEGHSVRERLRGRAGAQGRNLKPIYGIGKRLSLWGLGRREQVSVVEKMTLLGYTVQDR